MNRLVFANPAPCATAAKGMAGDELPAAVLMNLVMVAAAVSSSGLVLYALHTAFAAN